MTDCDKYKDLLKNYQARSTLSNFLYLVITVSNNVEAIVITEISEMIGSEFFGSERLASALWRRQTSERLRTRVHRATQLIARGALDQLVKARMTVVVQTWKCLVVLRISARDTLRTTK